MIVAVVDPGLCTSVVSVLDAGVEVFRFEADGGRRRIPELLELVAGSVDVDEWRVVVHGRARPVDRHHSVVALIAVMLAMVPTPAAVPGEGWPERFVLFPRCARAWSWLAGGWRR